MIKLNKIRDLLRKEKISVESVDFRRLKFSITGNHYLIEWYANIGTIIINETNHVHFHNLYITENHPRFVKALGLIFQKEPIGFIEI